jgi:hypothetical protein
MHPCCLQKLTPFGLLYYNALVALPASIAIALARGEFENLATYEYRFDIVSKVGMLA